jgi:hypothetical protein
MNPLPPGVLRSSAPLLECPYCGKFSRAQVCEYCRAQFVLVQSWIMESCNLHSQTLRPIVRSLAFVGVPELMVRAALLTLVLEDKLEARA